MNDAGRHSKRHSSTVGNTTPRPRLADRLYPDGEPADEGDGMTNALTTLELAQWTDAPDADTCARLTRELESGKVLFLPRLAFEPGADEQRFLSPQWLDCNAKNISYDPRAERLGHTSAQGNDRRQLAGMMARYAGLARELVMTLCPRYKQQLEYGLTSFRPVEARGRATSPKKDDTRLHVDAFASRPTQGRRILRVFCNVNPHGAPRVWEIGETFDAVATAFRDRVPPQLPGSAWLLDNLNITRSRRSAYDHIMLNLHDKPKLDANYQRTAPRTRVELPAHSTWLVFTDGVMHAALAGQFLLEQTFYLPVAAMQNEACAPLRKLEKLLQRQLA